MRIYAHTSSTAAAISVNVDYPTGQGAPRINVHGGSIYLSLDLDAAKDLAAQLLDCIAGAEVLNDPPDA